MYLCDRIQSAIRKWLLEIGLSKRVFEWLITEDWITFNTSKYVISRNSKIKQLLYTKRIAKELNKEQIKIELYFMVISCFVIRRVE